MDKKTLGTLVSTAVVGFGGGVYKGFCEGQGLDAGNCSIYIPVIFGALQGGIMGRELNDKYKKTSDEEITGLKENIIARLSGAALYGALGFCSVGVGYSLGYIAGRIA